MRSSSSHPSGRHYDLAIIGRGMIGSAAARHAAKMTRDNRIALIGPSEHSECASSNISDDVNAQRTIFGAHYDEGRMYRRVD